MSYTKILDFWFPNTEYQSFWFDKSVDKYICDNYLEILNNIENPDSELYQEWNKKLLGKLAIIIVLDQFTRNIYRDSEYKYKNDKSALNLALDMINKKLDIILPLNYRVFILMPLRHTKSSDMLDIVVRKIKQYQEEFKNNKILDKFALATYQSYTPLCDRIIERTDKKKIKLDNYYNILDCICENYNLQLNSNLDMILNIIESKEIYKIMKDYFINISKGKKINIGVSLSGGVDSMVILIMAKILEHTNIINKVYALHLEYANRDEAKQETKFLEYYCNTYNIPLYVRSIDYMNRSSVDRNFYEQETKKIRFLSYKYLIDKYNIKGFCLGHHYGDLGENVLMNIFTGKDLLDLFVMESDSVIEQVRLFRPLLNRPKSDIYYIANICEIPYFKDSTPDWSCRGVLRRKIMPCLIDQWGEGVVSCLADIGEKAREWNNVIESFVLKPILENIRYYKYGCKINLNAEYQKLPKVVWVKILTKIFHSMGNSMITKKNLDNFYKNIHNLTNPDYKTSFSNNSIGLYHDEHYYIFTCNFQNIKFNQKITYEVNQEIRNKIKYDDLLDGYYKYTEKYSDNHLPVIIHKFDKNKDSTRKLFTSICLLKDYIPKISSGVWQGEIGKIALIEIAF